MTKAYISYKRLQKWLKIVLIKPNKLSNNQNKELRKQIKLQNLSWKQENLIIISKKRQRRLRKQPKVLKKELRLLSKVLKKYKKVLLKLKRVQKKPMI